MGYTYSAWIAYGIPIPRTPDEVLEEKLAGFPGEGDDRVGFLTVGKFDDEDNYLVTRSVEADLGEHETVTVQDVTPYLYDHWNRALRRAALAVGVEDPPEPGWLLIAHAS